VKPPSAARKINDGPREKGDSRGAEKVGHRCKRYGTDTMALLPWTRSAGQSFRSGAVLCRDSESGHDARNSAASNTVALRLEVQGLVVHPEEPNWLALVPPRGVKCQADRLPLRLGSGAVGDLLQGGAHLFSSSVARSLGGADQPSQIADQ